MLSIDPISAEVPLFPSLPVPVDFPTAADSALASEAGNESAATCAPLRIEDLLIDLCRERAAALTGCETVVDCEPAGLRTAAEEGEKIRRCAALLMDSALTSVDPIEIDVSARPAGSEDSPLLLISLRVVPRLGSAPRIVPSRDPDELALLQLFVERSRGTLLISQVEEGVRRLSLGMEVSWSIDAPAVRAVGVPVRGRALIADDCPMVRRTARRLLEREGFEVSEAPGTLSLLSQLDPDRGAAGRPDWIFVDEAWIRPRADGTRGLRAVLEATIPESRVVVLTAAEQLSAGPFPGLAKPFAGRALQSLLDEGPAAASRNEAGERPNSLSRW